MAASYNLASYNLLDEPWIPCLTTEGELVTVGLREAFRRSERLAEVRAPSPLATAAILRLLLAIGHAALRGPKDNAERARLWRHREEFLRQVEAYLDRWQDRFDLFHPERPFWQEAELRLNTPRSISFIALEVAAPESIGARSGGLFDPPVDPQEYAATPAEAARFLVTRQAYTLGGLDRAENQPYGRQMRFESSPPVLGAMVFVTGGNLLETLLLSMVPYSDTEPVPITGSRPDAPIWERDELPWPPGERWPDGYLDYLTWPSCAIRLEPEAEGEHVVVRRVHVCARNQVAPAALQGDPFFAWRETRPLTLRRGRSLWRDSGALFGFASNAGSQGLGRVPEPHVLRQLHHLPGLNVSAAWGLLVIGADAERRRQAIHLWRAEELPLPRAILDEGEALEVVAKAVAIGEKVGEALDSVLREMARKYLGLLREVPVDADNVTALVRSWNSELLYWPALEGPFRSLLQKLCSDEPDLEEIEKEWRDEVRIAARRAFYHAAAQLGESAPALHARVHAERLLGGHLNNHLGARKNA